MKSLRTLCILIYVLNYLITANSQEDIVCDPWTCAATSCTPVGDCSGPNQEIRKIGLCKCCEGCFTLLDVGDICTISKYSTRICRKGLICLNGRCRRTTY